MKPSELVSKVVSHQAGLVLDTNVLLLYLIEKAKPEAHSEWKRTTQFTHEHVEYLALAVQSAKRLITTPHILAEVSNLSAKVPASLRDQYFDGLRDFVIEARERNPAGATIVKDLEFRSFDFADLGLVVLSSFRRPLVLTVDGPLTLELESRKLPFINLNHCIEGWSR